MQSQMQGTLWKWTNYFSGWQPRWFVLEDGILSYYQSKDDIESGCKGSVKMSVCDVSVHPTDAARLDLSIPGQQHFYLKASTVKERQEWLVALGTCKACLNNNASSPYTDGCGQYSLMKSKKSELRLYCDLLMQQVHSVKVAVTACDGNTPSVQELDKATALLGMTCDTFVDTLEQCMELSGARHTLDEGESFRSPLYASSPPRTPTGLESHGFPGSSLVSGTGSGSSGWRPVVQHRPDRPSAKHSKKKGKSASFNHFVGGGERYTVKRSSSVTNTYLSKLRSPNYLQQQR